MALIEQLAEERRRVLSLWRAVILARRATFTIPPSQRRWNAMPKDGADILPTLRRMRMRGEIQRLDKFPHIYEITVPYARTGPISEEEILMEVHPYAGISHLSALAFHGLTGALSKDLFVTITTGEMGDLIPVGTNPQDWVGLSRVRGQRVNAILDRPVHWTRVKPERYFGIAQYQPAGYTILVTTPERTLLDGLQQPELAGGIENVLRAWSLTRDTIDVDGLVAMVERFDITILRQRVGFLLEELGLSHPVLARWQASTNRGGSSKLMASMPYADTFSERWNLSLNVPVGVLREHSG